MTNLISRHVIMRVVPALLCLLLTLSPRPAAAEAEILKLTGVDATSGAKVSIHYTLEKLRTLPRYKLRTTTIWTAGDQDFEGVLLHVLWKASGLTMPRTIRATALNDYVADIPASDLGREIVLVADRLNGNNMRVRDKGPLWIIYPDAADSSDVLERMVWQLSELEAVD